MASEVLIAPCRYACPLGRPIQRHNVLLHYLGQLVKGGIIDEDKAFIKLVDEIFNFNPLFGICGYVCGLCENFCNRRQIDERVHIRFIERFIFDWYKEKVEKGLLPPYRPIMPEMRRHQRVVILGGGPAGLSAAFFLAKEGYNVEIYEKERLGGALRLIPGFRLPKSVTDFAIDQIITPLNIKICLGCSPPISVLKSEYDAILIATGTQIPRPVPPVAQDKPGVENAIDILRQISKGTLDRKKYAGRQVIVIGGSGVAIDTARSLRRFGAEVSLACLECEDRNSKDGILVNIEDEERAKQEGIHIFYSRGLNNVVVEESGRLGLQFVKCTSVYDLIDGRKIFNPQFDKQDVIEVATDYLVFAIGQLPDRDYLKAFLDENGRIEANPLTLQTPLQNVFVAGDVFKIGRVPEAIRAGKEAAISISRYLKGEDLLKERVDHFVPTDLPYSKEKIPVKPAAKPAILDVTERLKGFVLEEGGLSLEGMIQETSRCLHCGSCDNCRACVTLGFREDLCKMRVIEDKCDGCGYCVEVCPVQAISLKEYSQNAETKKMAVVDVQRCRGCGICQATCPKEGCEVAGFSLNDLRSQIQQALNI